MDYLLDIIVIIIAFLSLLTFIYLSYHSHLTQENSKIVNEHLKEIKEILKKNN